MSMSSSSLSIQPAVVQKAGVSKLVNRATNKANEYFRLINAKCPPYGELPTPQANIAKVMICIQLACIFHDIPYDKSELGRLSGVSQQDYIASLNIVRNVLELKPQIQFSVLCKEFGCPGMSNAAERCLDMYKKKFVEKVSDLNKNRVDFSAPAYKAVAFFITARHLKFKVDRNKLMEVTSCTNVQFSNVLSSMTELCDLKELIVTDSLKDIRERVTEQRKKKLEKEEKKNQPEQTEQEKSAKIEAHLTELMKKNRYLDVNTELSNTAVEKFIQADKKKQPENESAENNTNSTHTAQTNNNSTLKRPRPQSFLESEKVKPKSKKMKQLVLNFNNNPE